MLRNTNTQWGGVSKFFHWLIAILVLIMLIVGASFDYIPKSIRPIFYDIHKSTGITILTLMILRLLWRWINPVPQLPETTPHWQKIAAHTSHRLLYLVLILMPLSGWAMSTAANKPVNFWWLIHLRLPLVPQSKAVAHFFSTTHTVLAWIIVTLLCIHIAGAFKHLLINRDNVLQRMLPIPKSDH